MQKTVDTLYTRIFLSNAVIVNAETCSLLTRRWDGVNGCPSRAIGRSGFRINASFVQVAIWLWHKPTSRYLIVIRDRADC